MSPKKKCWEGKRKVEKGPISRRISEEKSVKIKPQSPEQSHGWTQRGGEHGKKPVVEFFLMLKQKDYPFFLQCRSVAVA